MASTMEAAQAVLAAFDTSLSRQWRDEDRRWRAEDRQWRADDLAFREEERRWFGEEAEMRSAEIRWREEDMNQRHVDNARYLWARFVEKNRRDVEEKSEQLKAISNLAALFAGFAVVTLTQFQVTLEGSPMWNIALYGILTAISSGPCLPAVPPFLSFPLLSSPFLSFPLLSSPFLSFPLSPFSHQVCLHTVAMVQCTLIMGSGGRVTGALIHYCLLPACFCAPCPLSPALLVPGLPAHGGHGTVHAHHGQWREGDGCTDTLLPAACLLLCSMPAVSCPSRTRSPCTRWPWCSAHSSWAVE
ncbi:unnamed protein product [Closterium sp. NIES-54]